MTSREYQREYARRKRRGAWLRAAVHAVRCPAMLSNQKPCRWPLTNRLVNGVTTPFCAQCDRKARGICLECRSEPVRGTVGKALRCTACQKRVRHDHAQKYRKRHPGKIRRQWRRRKARMLKNPVLRQAVLERKKLWRLANPKAVRRHKMRDNRTERAREYQKAYRERMRRLRAANELVRYHQRRRGEVVTHPCVKCRAAISGRAKKCEGCRTTEYRAARALLIGAAA